MPVAILPYPASFLDVAGRGRYSRFVDAVSPAISHPALRMFLERIRPSRKRISALYLFGSRARGDWRPDSDFDVLVVVPERTQELIDCLYDAVVKVNIETSLLISLKIFTLQDYNRLSSIPTPFFANIRDEGLRLGFDD